MRVSTFHPWGRVLKAMRIVSRIQDFCERESINKDLDYDDLISKYVKALDHPVWPTSAKLLAPFIVDEKSHPSSDTCEMAAELLANWYIEKRADNEEGRWLG